MNKENPRVCKKKMEGKELKNRSKQLLIILAAMSVLAFSLSGCGKRRSEIVSETESETQTESATEKITEKETERETQKLITFVDYTSKDGTVKITLPDNTWKITQDADEMRVFSSGTAAMINIVHASTESAMKNLTVMTTEDALKTALTKQYSDTTAYDVQSFESNTINGVNTYRYVVKYNATARMWAYSVTYGIVAADQAYVITGTVTDENKTLLAAVEKSVGSFRVLKDETLKSVTSDIIAGKTQKPTTPANATSAAELATLKDYGTSADLYANDNVNIRLAPGTDADILVTLNTGDKVSVVGETSGWFKVNVQGNIGYIRKDFLVNSQPAQTPETNPPVTADDTASAEINTETKYGSAVTLYASAEVNVRSKPNTSSDENVIGVLGGGNSVSVIGETDNWFVVSVNGNVGYVSKSYLTNDSSVANNNNNGSNTGNNGDGNNGGDNNGGGNGNNGGGSTGGSTSGPSSISGTVIGSTVDTVTVAGDDGNTYTIYTGEANVDTVDGIYDGVYVSVSVDNSQTAADGTMYATGVKGY